MDHHTYAKSGSKKWSVEEKRQLVEQRIAADELFSKYSPKHAEPWKQFKKCAKIGDFSEIALRKQWFSMVQRYRVQKANIASGTLTKQKIEELNKEWEFFGTIHAYMNQKTADLHSYALKEPNMEPPSNNLAIANVYSREELSPLMLGVLNDHNFCERSSPNGGDISDDVDEPLSTANNDSNNNEELNRLLAEATARVDREEMGNAYNEMDEVDCGPVMVGGEVSLSNGRYNDLDDGSLGSLTASSSPCKSPSPPKVVKQKSVATNVKKAKELSEKDKYYKHRLGFEQRMEQRLMGLCTVVGRLLQHFVPDVDIRPLFDIAENRDYNSQTPTTTSDTEEEQEPEIKQEEDDGFEDVKEEGDQDVKEEDDEDAEFI